MQVFMAGTDTSVGKTTIASWLALQTQSAYFKPIQTGSAQSTDSIEVGQLANVKIYPEIFCYREPLSPHLAAKLENDKIDLKKIILPAERNLIVEGAGGLLVPLNEKFLLIDLIKKLQIPVILVARSQLGTINHTLLSLEALNRRGIKTLGVIMNGPFNVENKKAIELYGNTQVIAEFPPLDKIDYPTLAQLPLSPQLKQIWTPKNDTF